MNDQPSPAEEEGAPPFEPTEATRLLPGPDALDADEAGRVLAQQPGRVVVWAGERATGKTTLTCELYERQRRPEARVHFAGSQTLLALEQRSHPSRAASGRRVRETRRTERDPEGRELLHLALAEPGRKPVHLLLADLPGEVFREVRDNVTRPEDLPLLTRADKLALLADGRRLADPKTRAVVHTTVRQLLGRLQAGDLPHPRTELALVVTMWDKVAGYDEVEKYWAPREQELLREIRTVDPRAPLLRVAARAPMGWAHQDNIDALRDWLLAPPRVSKDPLVPVPSWPSSAPPRLRRPKRLVSR